MNGFINPSSERPTDSFSISVLDPFFYPVSLFLQSTLIIQAQSILISNQLQQVIPSSNLTGDLSTLLFKIQTPSNIIIEQRAQMTIIIPSQLSISKMSPVSCNVFQQAYTPLTCTLSQIGFKAQIVISGLFDQSASIGPALLQLQISTFQNPISTMPTDSFQMVFRTYDGYLITSINSGMTLQMTNASQFASVKVTPQSLVNGEITNYIFLVKTKTRIPSSSQLQITFPLEVLLIQNNYQGLYCQGVQILLNDNLQCSYQQGKIVFQVLFQNTSQEQLAEGESFQFQVQNIRNPISTKLSSSFSLAILTSDSLYQISIQSSGITVQTSYPNTIQQSSIESLNPKLGQVSLYQLTFTPFNPLPQNAQIKIVIPIELQFNGTTSCQSILGLSSNITCSYLIQNNSILVNTQLTTSQLPSTVIKLAFGNLINPQQPLITNSFQVYTYTQDNYLIDQLTGGLQIAQDCNYPCKTCGLSPQICTSCQKNQIYKYLFNYTCLQSCPTGYFIDSNFNCMPCSSQCQQCSGSPTFCTQCADSSLFLYSGSGTCVGACPDGQFSDQMTKSCLNCNSPCQTCSNSTNCLSCDSSNKDKFFFKGSCLQSCPFNSLPGGSNGLTCQECSSNCKQCNNSVDECSSCNLQSSNPFLYGQRCIDQCPSGYAPSISDGSTCIVYFEQIIPFPILIFSVISVVLLLIIKLCNPFFHFKDAFIAQLSVSALVCWIYLLYLVILSDQIISSVILSYSICAHFILNIIWVICYCKYLRTDEIFVDWRQKNRCSEVALILGSFLLTYQVFRFCFSNMRLVKSPVTMFKDSTIYKSVYVKLSLVSIGCTFLPVIVQNIYNLFYTTPSHQLFYEDIESLIITFFLGLVLILDIYHKSKKIDETLKKRKEEGNEEVNEEGEKNLDVTPRYLTPNSKLLFNSDGKDCSDIGARLFHTVDDIEKFEQIVKDFIMINKQELSQRKGSISSNVTQVQRNETGGRTPRQIDFREQETERRLYTNNNNLMGIMLRGESERNLHSPMHQIPFEFSQNNLTERMHLTAPRSNLESQFPTLPSNISSSLILRDQYENDKNLQEMEQEDNFDEQYPNSQQKLRTFGIPLRKHFQMEDQAMNKKLLLTQGLQNGRGQRNDYEEQKEMGYSANLNQTMIDKKAMMQGDFFMPRDQINSIAFF